MRASLLALLLAGPAFAQTAVAAKPLGAIDPFKAGVAVDSLPDALWAHADTGMLGDVFSRLATPARSSAGLHFQRDLLSASTDGPTQGGLLTIRRARAIYAAGGVAALTGMLPKLPNADTPDLQQLAADVALLSNKADEACALEKRLKSGREQAYWLRLRAFCQVRAKDASAELTVSLARSQAVRDDGYFAGLAALQGGPTPAKITVRAPLDLVLAYETKALGNLDIASAPPPVWVVLAGLPDAKPELRADAAFRAASLGLIDGPSLAKAFLAVPGPQAPVAADLNVAKLNRVATLARLYTVAAKASDKTLSAQALSGLLQRAQTAGEFQALADASAPLLRTLPIEAVKPATASDLALAAGLAGKDAAAEALRKLAGAPAWLDIILAVARNDTPGGSASLDVLVNTAVKGDVVAKAHAARSYALLAPLGFTLSPANDRAMSAWTATVGTLPSLGTWTALTAAVARNAKGETASIALSLLPEGGPAKLDRATLSTLLAILSVQGFDKQARDLALETLLADRMALKVPAKPKP